MTPDTARGPHWLPTALLAALVATAAECAVLELRWHVFAGGFLNPEPLAGVQVPLFLATSLWLDFAAAAVFAIPLCRLLRGRLPGAPLQGLLAASSLCLLPVAIATVAAADIDRFVGDSVAYAGFGGGWSGRVLGAALLLAGALAALAVAWRVAGRLPAAAQRAAHGPRLARRPWLWAAPFLLASPLVLAPWHAHAQHHLAAKTVGGLVFRAARAATDFDGDGYGLLRAPRDPAPFDAAVHPYAVDVPGNGVDENGVDGDLDSRGGFEDEHGAPPRFVRRPDVVVFVLESFRADNLDAEVGGKPVAPVLRAAREAGAVTGPAYTHNGFTIQSLCHLFTGTLSLSADTTLLDDFAANGYYTACLSGQDEAFGDIERRTGMIRADLLKDARDHLDRRLYPSTASGSLVVPWRVVVGDVEDMLAAHSDDERPIFCYVNFQDCHYPYDHRDLDVIVAGDPLPRSRIAPKNAEHVRRTYRNAAANVDRAVGRVLDAWERARGRRPAFVAVSDHGESLYEGGVLGHGVGISETQTSIVFLASGLPADCVFPLGLADVRGVLRRALSEEDARPAARIDEDRWVFQYVGTVGKPSLLGAAWASGGLVRDLRSGELAAWGAPPRPPSAPFRPLTRLWERIVLVRRGAE